MGREWHTNSGLNRIGRMLFHFPIPLRGRSVSRCRQSPAANSSLTPQKIAAARAALAAWKQTDTDEGKAEEIQGILVGPENCFSGIAMVNFEIHDSGAIIGALITGAVLLWIHYKKPKQSEPQPPILPPADPIIKAPLQPQRQDESQAAKPWRSKIIIHLVNLLTAIILGILAIRIGAALQKFIPNWFGLAAMAGIVVVIGLGTWWIIRKLSRGSLQGLLFFILPFLLVLIGITLIPPIPQPIPIPSIPLTISITNIPPIGFGPNEQDDIGGEVKGLAGSAAYTNYQVVIYAFTKVPPGRDPWSVEPSTVDSLTHIGNKGTWNSRIYLGSQYAAILVTNGYQPAPSLPHLPTPGGGVIAITSVEGKNR
jgi:hypothetical protein